MRSIFLSILLLVLTGRPVLVFAEVDFDALGIQQISILKEKVIQVLADENFKGVIGPVTPSRKEHIFWAGSEISQQSSLQVDLRLIREMSRDSTKIDAKQRSPSPSVSPSSPTEMVPLEQESQSRNAYIPIDKEAESPVNAVNLKLRFTKEGVVVVHPFAVRGRERRGIAFEINESQVSYILPATGQSTLLIFTMPKILDARGILLCPVHLSGRQEWESLDVLSDTNLSISRAQFFGKALAQGEFESGLNSGRAVATILHSGNIVPSQQYSDESEGRHPTVEIFYRRIESQLKVGMEDTISDELNISKLGISAAIGSQVEFIGPAGQMKSSLEYSQIVVFPLELSDERIIDLRGNQKIRYLGGQCSAVFSRKVSALDYSN